MRGEDDPTDKTFQGCANLLINNLVNRPMDVGLQRVKDTVAEQNLTARFALFLQHIYSSVLTEKSLVPSVPTVDVGHQDRYHHVSRDPRGTASESDLRVLSW